MANCVNCGKKITMLNFASQWKFSDKVMCQKCTDSFESLLLYHKIGWKSSQITRELIDENLNYLQLNDSGIEFLHEYADYVQSQITPEELERMKAEEEEKKREEEDKERRRKQMEENRAREQEVNRELAKILISSGFNFDGYRIIKYSGYISGDDAVQIPRSGLFDRGQNGKNLTDALVRIRRQALKELKQAAYDLGCNAVIGVDFDYITLDPETATLTGGTLYEPYVICVTANGNAVVIEKIED